MRYTNKTIKSLSDLLKQLKKDTAKLKTPLWFRGHSRTDYKLLPSLYRYVKDPNETNLIEKFKQNATFLINPSGLSEYDWLFLMQHNGVPTRLLDWTESPLVALYFACISERKKDGCINVLLPIELNKKASVNQNHIVSVNDKAVAERYSPETFRSEDTSSMLPVAIICPRNNARIQAQLGTFTIFHKDKTSIDKIGDGKHIWQYNIPSINKEEIIKELNLLGIDEFRLFPELPSLGSLIKNNIL